MRKKHSVLTRRIIFGFVVLAILICLAGTAFGYVQYNSYIRKQYNDTAYQTAAVFRDYFTTEELREYIRLARDYKNGAAGRETLDAKAAQEHYKQVDGQLMLLRENMGVNDIYLAYLDVEELYGFTGDTQNWNPAVYIFDCYIQPELNFSFGDMGGLNPEFLEDAIKIMETGERSDNYFISESEFGYNTSAILPVVLDGKAVAVIGVEVPMRTLQNALREYVVRSVASMALITVVCIAIYMNYLYRTMVMPINMIAQEARNFVREEHKISEYLDRIKTGDEIQLLSETILQMEIDINQYIDNLTAVTAEKERIGAELNVATRIQASMLPRIFPPFPEREEFDLFASMTPAKEVGGDFYDFFMVDEDHLVLVIADVSGKGVPAALFMVIAKTLLKNAAESGASPKEILERVNNQLCDNNEGEMFVTVWLGKLQVSTGKLVCANAGHDDPVVIHANGDTEIMASRHGLVLAGMENVRYREQEFTLMQGDRLFVYTDGVSEATSAVNELYGRERLLKALYGAAGGSTEAIIAAVKEDIDRFVGDAPQFDDITMLAFEMKGGISELSVIELLPAHCSMEEITGFVEEYLSAKEVPAKTIAQINIAVDEIVSNILSYSQAAEAAMGIAAVDSRILLRFTDNGVPYDPTALEEPDVTLSAEERRIGGLGIFMVKKMMDQVKYEYADGNNVLILEKNI